MDDSSVQFHIESRFSDLRTWILVHGIYSFACFVVIFRSVHTRELIGMILFFYALLSEVVRFMFHRADKMQGKGVQFIQYNEPPCGGVFGRGGASSSFVFFYLYMLVVGGKLLSMWQTCSTTTRADHVTLDEITVLALIVCSLCFSLSLWIAEMSRQMSEPLVI